jgi:hypothetical protein
MLAACIAALGRGGEQAPAGRARPADAASPTPFIYGARFCAPCHDPKNRERYTKDEIEKLICRMDEYPIFDSQDKHKLAFRGLVGPRGQQMSRLLGKDVTQIEACIKCHSVPESGVDVRQYRREDDGVTCVACHGAFEEWVEKHPSATKAWRDVERPDKERRFGMIDLWDPVRRAETCASCHVGCYKQGKVVTHAMYAAGHPPLPSFEPSTFSDAQPKHWEYLSEKSPERWNQVKPPPDRRNLERTQLVAVGGLVALRESMNLFADEADANRPEPIGAQWPDFARFECYACHHDLQAEEGSSWRQVRRRKGQAGRPSPPDWPIVLVRLGIGATGPQRSASLESQLEEKLMAFHESAKLNVFGEPKSVASAARRVAACADSAIQELRQTIFDSAMATRMLQQLCSMTQETVPDYESARQIAWAFRIIYHESVPGGERDPAIERALADLEAKLALNLPPEKKQALIETALQDRLRSIANFNPVPFQAQFASIAERLAKPAQAPAPAR